MLIRYTTETGPGNKNSVEKTEQRPGPLRAYVLVGNIDKVKCIMHTFKCLEMKSWGLFPQAGKF